MHWVAFVPMLIAIAAEGQAATALNAAVHPTSVESAAGPVIPVVVPPPKPDQVVPVVVVTRDGPVTVSSKSGSVALAPEAPRQDNPHTLPCCQPEEAVHPDPPHTAAKVNVVSTSMSVLKESAEVIPTIALALLLAVGTWLYFRRRRRTLEIVFPVFAPERPPECPPDGAPLPLFRPDTVNWACEDQRELEQAG
jgi:hypothetical protein